MQQNIHALSVLLYFTTSLFDIAGITLQQNVTYSSLQKKICWLWDIKPEMVPAIAAKNEGQFQVFRKLLQTQKEAFAKGSLTTIRPGLD